MKLYPNYGNRVITRAISKYNNTVKHMHYLRFVALKYALYHKTCLAVTQLHDLDTGCNI